MDSCTFAVPIPAPLAGAEIVIHGVCVVAVHVHPAPERTSNNTMAAPSRIFAVAGVSTNVHPVL
jgi:hypothetical protein